MKATLSQNHPDVPGTPQTTALTALRAKSPEAAPLPTHSPRGARRSLWCCAVAAVCFGVLGPQAYSWQSLFDGESLGKWKETDFGNQDAVGVQAGCIVLRMGGADLSGVTWTGDLFHMNYEIELEAKRVAGNDFFCGLTFPVGEACCSLIVGGWGGTLVGLSSIDNMDASENETTSQKTFETGRWYAIRLRVSAKRIRAWIDNKQVVNIHTEGRKIGVRYEVEASRPLGIAAWNTQAALRKIRIRALSTVEIEAPEAQ